MLIFDKFKLSLGRFSFVGLMSLGFSNSKKAKLVFKMKKFQHIVVK